MAKREDLRISRKGQVINAKSTKMESALAISIVEVQKKLEKKFHLSFEHRKKVHLKEIVEDLQRSYPEVAFRYHFDSSFLKPDGGILSVKDQNGFSHVILISEAKRQGTNDLRAEEGLKKQAMGNAIERLGKNVIGFRTWLAQETIIPFVVFGEGYDFNSSSSILDRVSTIAMFAPLNTIEVAAVGESGVFKRGSFYFREKTWTSEEMTKVLYEVAERAIYYYFSKYGEDFFKQDKTKS